MSEFLIPSSTTNVFGVDPDMNYPDRICKAVLAMQATGLYVDGDEKFEATNERLAAIASKIGRPATMTYEDVVINNPGISYGFYDRGPVVISREPDIARQEGAFYLAHYGIERSLYSAIDALEYMDGHKNLYGRGEGPPMLMSGKPPDEFTASTMLAAAVKKVRELYKGLDPESFAVFRPYFVGINGYPGASGLYSVSIPILDLLIHGGSNMTTEEREQIKLNNEQGLYPNYMKGNVLLGELLEADSPELEMPEYIRGELTGYLNAFRRSHREAVKKFVPGAMQGEAAGSGGVEDVAGYLASKVITVEKGCQNG